MKKIVLMLLGSLIFASLVFAAEKPMDDSLIQAWETLQKSDPHTVTFENIADRRYKFKTDLFPFDGELKVIDVTIDDTELEEYYHGFTLGYVDIELVGLPKDVPQKYSRKYYMWARNNTFYYDKNAGKWLSPHEYQSAIIKSANEPPRTCGLQNIGFFLRIFVLLFVLVILIFLLQRSRKVVKSTLQKQEDAIARVEKSIALSEKNIQQGEETNKLLKEILQVLKKPKSKK